ncbi:MAG: HAMP domain-containing histidine kinase [Clostridia bacterium]|nr:HAMP domain-containing histidine kinase [Clostridia bacterium]
MDKLKKKIIRYFIVCAVGISIAESVSNIVFDVVMENVILPRVEQNPNPAMVVLILAAAVMISILILAAGALIFYRLVKKAVEEESRRRAAEQNMLYSCIAHDLKTPMTSVQGFAAALRDGKIKDEEKDEICDIIYLKTKHLNELVDTLSAYSKLGTEDFALNFENVNICTLVRDMAAMNYSDFESRGMELVVDIPDEPIICRLDKKEFTRAVNNVIVNACKHNRSGCEVLIRVHNDGEHTYITIADTGDGIPEELVPNLFDPFVCGNASRTSGTGSGLGLAVSARIAGKHGAKLSYITDIEGYSKGFVFKITDCI